MFWTAAKQRGNLSCWTQIICVGYSRGDAVQLTSIFPWDEFSGTRHEKGMSRLHARPTGIAVPCSIAVQSCGDRRHFEKGNLKNAASIDFSVANQLRFTNATHFAEYKAVRNRNAIRKTHKYPFARNRYSPNSTCIRFWIRSSRHNRSPSARGG